jgi:hypothetical protein
VISSSALVLVAVINNQRDLDIARLLGWYRIPLRTAPKVVAVDYLAFYQTGAFEREKWQIQYIAPVHGHELTTRAELLRDEPNHPRAREEYYKLQLGQIEKLPHPIYANKWRRLTFLYTTGEYLLQAKSLNDLVIQTEERQTLWRALRERSIQTQQYVYQDISEMQIPPDVLAFFLGMNENGETNSLKR